MVNGYNPTSLAEALDILDQHEVCLYAGGTDLMVKNSEKRPYLFVKNIPELGRIYEDEQFIHIGAAVTFTEALGNPLVPPLMKEAVSRIAAPAIRNQGTFGGNIGNASAKADSVMPLFAMDGQVVIASRQGERTVNISDLYLGRGKLDKKDNEIIKEILIPKAVLAHHYYYKKVGGREALAISRISFAGIFHTENGKISNVAAAFGAVSGVVLRFKDLEAKLIGKSLEEAQAMKDEYLAAYDQAMVLTRGRVSAEYRKTVCLNLLSDFLSQNGI